MLPNNLKQKTIEEKIQVLSNYIDNENSNNDLLALNLFLLIKRDNNFDETFFEHEDVIFNDIMEFIDIADALHDKLQVFIETLLGIYLSCLKNCSIDVADNTPTMPTVYLHVLYMMDYITLSKLMLLYNPVSSVEKYKESYDVVLSLSNKLSCFGVLMNDNINLVSDCVEKINGDSNK